MPQLSHLAIRAILNEWHPQEYDPPHTDVREWIRSIDSLCDTYGIPDVQRPQCATQFIRDDLRIGLREVLAEAREQFGSVRWNQFKIFMVAFDTNFRERESEFPLSPMAVLGIAAGGVLLFPAAAVGALSFVGFTSAGVAAGSLAATIQSIVYGGATGGLFSLLQSAGATMVMPSAGTIFTGAAATGVGVVAAANDQLGTSNSELLRRAADTIARGGNPDVPEVYLLTPRAILAIANAWNVGTYNPPGTNCAGWLRRIHTSCERYGVPISQRAPCAMHHMSADCKEAAHAAGCYDMTWDKFTAWVRKYDYEERVYVNGNLFPGSFPAPTVGTGVQPELEYAGNMSRLGWTFPSILLVCLLFENPW